MIYLDPEGRVFSTNTRATPFFSASRDLYEGGRIFGGTGS